MLNTESPITAEEGVLRTAYRGPDTMQERLERAERQARLYRSLYHSAKRRADEYCEMLQEALEW